MQVTKPPVSKSWAVGFLTALATEDEAVVGGFLVLNLAARPLEFHCTAPVKATRAQQILYGPTLRPFLYGEQIGGALLNKSKLKPQFVVTDQHNMLAVRGACETPIACIVDADVDRPSDSVLQVGRNELVVARGYPKDRDVIESLIQQLDDELDLVEPFTRIQEAIVEAQKSRKSA